MSSFSAPAASVSFGAAGGGGATFAYGKGHAAFDLLGGKSSSLDASLRQLSALTIESADGLVTTRLDDTALREAFPLLGIRN